MINFKEEVIKEIHAIDWDNSFEGKAIVDSEFKIIECNQPLTHMVGYTHYELVGKSLKDLTLTTDYEADKEMFSRLVRGQENDGFYEITKMYVPKGGKHPFLGRVRVDAVTDENGTFKYGLMRVVTVHNGSQAQALRDLILDINKTNITVSGFVRKYFKDNPVQRAIAICTLLGLIYGGGSVMLDTYYETRRIQEYMIENRELSTKSLNKIEKHLTDEDNSPGGGERNIP